MYNSQRDTLVGAVGDSTADGVTGLRVPVHKTQARPVVTQDMDDIGSRPAEGQRVGTSLDGQTVQGTIESVTYTPKKGNLVARVSLDDPGPDGQAEVAVAVEDLEPLD